MIFENNLSIIMASHNFSNHSCSSIYDIFIYIPSKFKFQRTSFVPFHYRWFVNCIKHLESCLLAHNKHLGFFIGLLCKHPMETPHNRFHERLFINYDKNSMSGLSTHNKHFVAALCCRIYGQQSTESFPQEWVFLLNQVVKEGKPFNQSDLLAQQLNIDVFNAINLLKGKQAIFYMFSYLMDEICTQNSFPNMNWNCSIRYYIVHIYRKLLLKCNHR